MPVEDACPGVTVPNSSRPLLRCGSCQHYQWGADGMVPLMRQRSDRTWHCPNEAPIMVVGR